MRGRISLGWLTATWLLATAATWLLAASAALAAEVVVRVGHNKLEPAEFEVAVGTTVVFHNLDQMPGGHTIVADDGSFQSPGLAKDARWSHTFSKPGVYTYSIKEHPSAKGRIVVE
jgi:plastocyanin